jgi:hypothetical protein
VFGLVFVAQGSVLSVPVQRLIIELDTLFLKLLDFRLGLGQLLLEAFHFIAKTAAFGGSEAELRVKMNQLIVHVQEFRFRDADMADGDLD